MAGLPTTYRTHPDADRVTRAAVFKASVDTHNLTSTALLSHPDPDLAGDIVVPEGMDWSRHMADPRVDLEHRRDPSVGAATVGWAHSGLGRDDGYYTVRPVNLPVSDGQTRSLWVGTTHFDPSDKLQTQAFALVERDILPAVSVEFVPDMAVAKALGRSPLEPRNAYEFGRVKVLRYTLCAKGVCPTALVAKSVYDPLRSVLAAGRIGGEELHPVIRKAFAHHLPGKSNAVTSGFVGAKAMDEQTMTAAPDDAEAGGSVNGITALYNHAQALMDLCDQLETDAESSDSAEVVKDIKRLCEMGRAAAEKVMATADKHNDKLEAAKGGKEEEPESDDDDEEEDDDDTADMDTDDEGNLKAIPPKYAVVVKSLRVKRYTLAEIRKAEEAARVPPTPAEGDSPEDVAELEKQIRLFRRDKQIYA
jgi:hypothetical protein